MSDPFSRSRMGGWAIAQSLFIAASHSSFVHYKYYSFIESSLITK
jgi:hypothetical protein